MFKEAVLIDGRYHADKILAQLKKKVEYQKEEYNRLASLAIILIGRDPASSIYIRNKVNAAKNIGIRTIVRDFDEHVTESLVLNEIARMNEDAAISGIIVQMPLPAHISKEKVINKIDPGKDVDGFHPFNVGLLYSGYTHGFIPCTARGCLELIKFTGIDPVTEDLSGKRVVIIGRSNIVGRPLAALLLQENATVTLCHSKTRDLAEITSASDIVVSAVGKPGFLGPEYFSEKAVVIDVGINRIGIEHKYRLIGDVDFPSVRKKVSYITPVPGGVGPMTVAYLLTNTFEAMLRQQIKPAI